MIFLKRKVELLFYFFLINLSPPAFLFHFLRSRAFSQRNYLRFVTKRKKNDTTGLGGNKKAAKKERTVVVVFVVSLSTLFPFAGGKTKSKEKGRELSQK